MSLGLNEVIVDTWLKRNEQFTNEFILHWVKDHPELHLALFKSNPYFEIPKSLTEIVDLTCSKDSGVDIRQGVSSSSQIQSEVPVVPSLKIASGFKNLEKEVKQKSDKEMMEIHAEFLRAERLEEMLVMSAHLHTKTFLPLEIIMKVMNSAQQFLKCTLIHLLLSDSQPPSSEETGNILQISTAFVVPDKKERYLPCKAKPQFIPCLIELAKPTHQLGSTFEIDYESKTICVCLRGAFGMTVGFLVLIYSDKEIASLIELDLIYLELFSQICGTAIENSLIIADSMKQLDPTDLHIHNMEEEISALNISKSSQSVVSCSDGELECDEEIVTLSISCPELAV